MAFGAKNNIHYIFHHKLLWDYFAITHCVQTHRHFSFHYVPILCHHEKNKYRATKIHLQLYHTNSPKSLQRQIYFLAYDAQHTRYIPTTHILY